MAKNMSHKQGQEFAATKTQLKTSDCFVGWFYSKSCLAGIYEGGSFSWLAKP